MKPRLLSLIVICVAALSCAKESVETRADSLTGQINFSTFLDGFTRGTVTDDGAGLATAGGFDVWAIRHAGVWNVDAGKAPLLDDVHVTGSVSGGAIAWNYGASASWPEEDHVSFFAYGPSGSATVGTPTAEGVPTIDFEVASEVREQQDLMIASPVYDKTILDYPDGRAVNLMFNHVLSRIVLSGSKVSAAGQNIKVKSVRFDGLYSAGTAGLGTATPAWNVDETATASYSLSIEDGELADVVLLSTSTDLMTEAGLLFLMPQSLERAAGLEVMMEVTLDIDGVERIELIEVSYPTEWLAGKSYNYQLVIEGDRVDLVLVSIDDMTLTEWGVDKMIQSVPLSDNRATDERRLYSALDGLGYLNLDVDNNNPSPETCNYFVLYLMNNVSHDVTLNMNGYEDMFTSGEYVVFHGEKLLESWTPGCTFRVDYDITLWSLESASNSLSAPGTIALMRI